MITVISIRKMRAFLSIEKLATYSQTRIYSNRVRRFCLHQFHTATLISNDTSLLTSSGNFLFFLFAAYLLGILFDKIGMVPQLGYLVAGTFFGPSGVDIVPFPAVVEWFGELSVVALAFDAGLATELSEVENESEDLIANALSGTLISVLAGLGIAYGLGLNAKMTIALIACMYPTGKEIAISMLDRGGMGNTPAGSYIRIACALDDFIPLILVVFLHAAASSDDTNFEQFLPLAYTLGLFIVVGVPIIMFLPKILDRRILSKVKKSVRWLVTVALIIILATGLVVLFIQVNASHLVATFITGITFCQIKTTKEELQDLRENFLPWFRNIFFAAGGTVHR